MAAAHDAWAAPTRADDEVPWTRPVFRLAASLAIAVVLVWAAHQTEPPQVAQNMPPTPARTMPQPEMNGFAVLQMMNGKNVEIPTIILTALSRKESVVKAREFGVSSYLIKPIRPEEILAKAAEILGGVF